jgi:AcrR family transcriptional regulator
MGAQKLDLPIPSVTPSEVDGRTGGARRDGVATKLAIIQTAEVLFAQRGLDGISLREIGEAAGQRNTGVVQYYFGDRDGLIRAIFERGSRQEGGIRDRMITGFGSDPSVAELVEALVVPFAETIREGSSYIAFLARLLSDHTLRQLLEVGTATRHPSWILLADLLFQKLSFLPKELAETRMHLATHSSIITLAAYEPGVPGAPLRDVELALQVRDLVNMLTRLLTTPAPQADHLASIRRR